LDAGIVDSREAPEAETELMSDSGSALEPSPLSRTPRRGPLTRLGAVFWNREDRRIRALWRVTALVALILGSGLAVRATGLLPGPDTRAFPVVASLLRLIIAAAAVWLTGRFLDRRRFRDFGLSLDRRWWTDLGFGLSLGAGLMSAIFVVEWALGWVEVTDTLRTTVPGEAFARAILAPATIFVCVGIVEELVARGYLLRNLAEGLAFPRLGGPRSGLLGACVVSSALFAFGHAGNPNATWVSTASIAVAGVFLALGFLLTGELAIPIGLHVTWNFFQGSVFSFPVSGVSTLRTSVIATEQLGPTLWTGGAFGPEGGLLGLAAMLLGAAVVLVWVRWHHGVVRLATHLAEPPLRGVPGPAAEEGGLPETASGTPS
jgi:membrane protease YdiL (CAAX protease family)